MGRVRRAAGRRKACKALHLSLGGEALGHEVTALLDALPAEQRAPVELVDQAKALDKLRLDVGRAGAGEAGSLSASAR